MDPASLGAHLSILRDHFAPFVILLFGLPALTFLAMKFWTAGHSAKAPRSTEWFVSPADLESESARMHSTTQRHSVVFAHQLHPSARHAVQVRTSSPRRSN